LPQTMLSLKRFKEEGNKNGMTSGKKQSKMYVKSFKDLILL